MGLDEEEKEMQASDTVSINKYKILVQENLNPRILASILETYNAHLPFSHGEDASMLRPIEFSLTTYADAEEIDELAQVKGTISQVDLPDGATGTSLKLTITSIDSTTPPIELSITGVTSGSIFTPSQLDSHFFITPKFADTIAREVAEYLYLKSIERVVEWINFRGYIESDGVSSG